MCVYIHNSWCNDTAVIERHCCPDLEFLTLKCRQFYLPREFSTVFITAVYVHLGMGIVKVLTVLLLLPIPLIDPVL